MRDHAAAVATEDTRDDRKDDDCSSRRPRRAHTQLTVLRCSLINSDRRDASLTAAASLLLTVPSLANSKWNSSSNRNKAAKPMTFDEGHCLQRHQHLARRLWFLVERQTAALWLISLSTTVHWSAPVSHLVLSSPLCVGSILNYVLIFLFLLQRIRFNILLVFGTYIYISFNKSANFDDHEAEWLWWNWTDLMDSYLCLFCLCHCNPDTFICIEQAFQLIIPLV